MREKIHNFDLLFSNYIKLAPTKRDKIYQRFFFIGLNSTTLRRLLKELHPGPAGCEEGKNRSARSKNSSRKHKAGGAILYVACIRFEQNSET